VDQIHVDVIGGEMPQALLERGRDPRAAAVATVRCFRIADADLGDETDVASPGAESAGEHLLGNAHAVGFCGIEAVDAGIESVVHGLVELRSVDWAIGAADFPTTEANRGHLPVGATELPIFHGVFLASALHRKRVR
jgi:hypothetical protein